MDECSVRKDIGYILLQKRELWSVNSTSQTITAQTRDADTWTSMKAPAATDWGTACVEGGSKEEAVTTFPKLSVRINPFYVCEAVTPVLQGSAVLQTNQDGPRLVRLCRVLGCHFQVGPYEYREHLAEGKTDHVVLLEGRMKRSGWVHSRTHVRTTLGRIAKSLKKYKGCKQQFGEPVPSAIW
ncbi:hypothetical protein Bbelb_200710 [Branchiostoma belcheri]|nr:hypothetical protein Bbelb_200710 [Branchiostoma belcheri]